MLLRPLPFDDADRLVRLFHVPPQATPSRHAALRAVAGQLLRLAARGDAFEGMAIYRRSFTLTGSGAPRAINVATSALASSTSCASSRRRGVFLPEEDAPGARVVVISNGFWRTQMGRAATSSAAA